MAYGVCLNLCKNVRSMIYYVSMITDAHPKNYRKVNVYLFLSFRTRIATRSTRNYLRRKVVKKRSYKSSRSVVKKTLTTWLSSNSTFVLLKIDHVNHAHIPSDEPLPPMYYHPFWKEHLHQGRPLQIQGDTSVYRETDAEFHNP